MNLQRREEIRELVAEIAQYEELGAALYLEGKARDAIAELLAHIATLEQTAAERVIARGAARALAQPSDATLASLAACGSTEGAVRATLSWARRMLARTDGPTPDYTGEGSAWVPPVEPRAVVGEGVAVGDELCREIAALSLEIRKIEESGYPENTRHYVQINDRRHEALSELDALRANQGGADARKAN